MTNNKVNITIPVFNRHQETLTTLRLLRKRKHNFVITVVDNASEDALRSELVRLAESGEIDTLFLLDKNYGVSCACNLGWAMVDAPFFMKLDNDIFVLSDSWLDDIFYMWGEARNTSIFGPAWQVAENNLRVETPRGHYWQGPVSLSGAALLVSAKVQRVMGRFSEDYGLYGEEDADYCLRCHHAGIKKFSFAADSMLHHNDASADYDTRGISKRAAHNSNVGYGLGEGLFALNLFLYQHSLRPLRAPALYQVEKVHGYHVWLRKNEEYAHSQAILLACCDIFNASQRNPDSYALAAMKELLKACPVL